MKKTFDIITLGVCFAICLLIGALTLLLPAKSFSEEENRSLAGSPVFSARSLMSGKYFQDATSFFSDHVAFRGAWVRGRTAAELCVGRQESGGVLFYPDGALAQRGLGASKKLLSQNLGAIDGLPDDAVCVLVPRAIDVLGLPRGAGESEAASAIRDAAYSSQGLGGLLWERFYADGSGERIYYATDHHLTTYGAYLSYVFLGERLGYKPYEREYFEEETVTRDFFGTAYSAAGLLCAEADTVEIWRYEGEELVRVTREDGSGEILPLYDMSFVEQKDKYRVFLGGNHGVLRVRRGEKMPRLLLIKDSYANALIPFLALHYDVTVVDPRYTTASFEELVSGEEYDEILIFCGIDTLSAGNDLARLLRR